MAYKIAPFSTTLSVLEGHSPIASFSKWDFSFSCTAVDKISTDIARRAVPLQ